MATFKYAPQWQGVLSGRSFEKQTEDAINAILQRLDEVSAAQSQVATQTSNGLMSAADKTKLDGIQGQLDALDARIAALE